MTVIRLPHPTFWAILLLMPTVLFISACSQTKPSDEDIKSMAAIHFDNEYKQLFTASNVIKLNGYNQNENHYIAELTITATANYSFEEYMHKQWVTDKNTFGIDKFASSLKLTMLRLTMPEFKAGDTLDFHKDYLFINTDNGWRLQKEINAENNQFAN